MLRACFTVLALVVALPVWAQPLELDIRDGLVTLSATNVPVRQVLAEWARVGGTRVVGAERITGPPLTLQLEGVPEAKALDIVLRGAAGYMAAARSPQSVGGLSIYDRIMVLASSTPPAAAAGAGAAAVNRPAANRFGVPPAIEPVESATESPDVADLPQGNPFADAFAQQGTNPFNQQGANPFGQPIQPTPFGQPVPQPGQFPQGGFFQPLQPASAPPAQGFFGVVGSATPGLVQQPVQPQPPAPPNVRPRPQG
jgi:hypothetical protein